MLQLSSDQFLIAFNHFQNLPCVGLPGVLRPPGLVGALNKNFSFEWMKVAFFILRPRPLLVVVSKDQFQN